MYVQDKEKEDRGLKMSKSRNTHEQCQKSLQHKNENSGPGNTVASTRLRTGYLVQTFLQHFHETDKTARRAAKMLEFGS